MAHQSSRAPRITIATNNGDIGGGEVMLLNIARALDELGVHTTVVGPSHPPALIEAARTAGHRAVVLEARTRPEWMRALRRWDRSERVGLLWCNGLVPSAATAGHRRRIVHLHQRSRGAMRALEALARRGALATLVPSEWMRTTVPGAEVFPNWVAPIPQPAHDTPPAAPFVLGFLGRPSVDKGIPVLAHALARLQEAEPNRFRLLLAGEPRFVSESDRTAVEGSLAPVASLVERPGWVSPSEFFHRIDLLVCPSVWPESFGLVAAEAMAARVPLLVSDAGALPEVVGRDESVIVPAGDAVALAEAIRLRATRLRADDADAIAARFRRWHLEYSPEAGRERVRRLLTELGEPTG